MIQPTPTVRETGSGSDLVLHLQLAVAAFEGLQLVVLGLRGAVPSPGLDIVLGQPVTQA